MNGQNTTQSNFSTPFPHLDEKVKLHLNESNADRIRRIRQTRWYHYGAARDLLSEMEALMEPTNNKRVQGIAITSEANNGKSVLVRRFVKNSDYQPVEREDGTGIDVPVVLIDAPHKPNDGWLLGEILTALNVPYRTKGDLEAKTRQVTDLFKRLNVRMLIIDEISDLISGSPVRQREILTLIKQISTRTGVAVVMTGVPAIVSALASNDQINSRFSKRSIPSWTANKEFLQLLKAIEKQTPLKTPSNLAAEENTPLASLILAKSQGRIGWIIDILQKSAIEAINSGTEKIDLKIVNSIQL